MLVLPIYKPCHWALIQIFVFKLMDVVLKIIENEIQCGNLCENDIEFISTIIVTDNACPLTNDKYEQPIRDVYKLSAC